MKIYTKEEIYNLIQRGQADHITRLDLENAGYRLHHVSLYRGYVSRKGRGELPVENYNGRYGRGCVVRSCNYNSTIYSYISYYI